MWLRSSKTDCAMHVLTKHFDTDTLPEYTQFCASVMSNPQAYDMCMKARLVQDIVTSEAWCESADLYRGVHRCGRL